MAASRCKPVKVTVFGDSYVNFDRFKDGIEGAFSEHGTLAEVESVARPGFHSGRLLAAVKELAWDIDQRGDVVLLVLGINDIINRRGTAAFSMSLQLLIEEWSRRSRHVFVLEILNFDENASLSGFFGKTRNKLAELIFDRGSGRVQRYRAAAAAVGSVIDTATFLPGFDVKRFKDRIHLTDTEFRRLADHVGRQIVHKIFLLEAEMADTETKNTRLSDEPGDL